MKKKNKEVFSENEADQPLKDAYKKYKSINRTNNTSDLENFLNKVEKIEPIHVKGYVCPI